MQKKQVKKETESKNSEPVHVMLGAPIEIRKGLLGATLDATKILKTGYELKEIRKTKYELLEHMHGIQGDLKELVKVLEKQGLPIVKFKEEGHEVSGHEIKSEVHKAEEVTDDEITKLKAELEAIEHKLKGL